MKISESKKLDNFVRIKHNVKECSVHYKNAIQLVKTVKLPKENEAIYIWVQGNFVFGDFLVQFITENEIEVKELTIITLSISESNIAALSELLNQEWVEKINFLVSSYFIRTEKIKHTNSIKLLEKAAENDKFKIYHANTHQKVTLIETKQGAKYVLHGSANMKGSQNYEQLMIENNSMLYDFNKEYFNNLKK